MGAKTDLELSLYVDSTTDLILNTQKIHLFMAKHRHMPTANVIIMNANGFSIKATLNVLSVQEKHSKVETEKRETLSSGITELPYITQSLSTNGTTIHNILFIYTDIFNLNSKICRWVACGA